MKIPEYMSHYLYRQVCVVITCLTYLNCLCKTFLRNKELSMQLVSIFRNLLAKCIDDLLMAKRARQNVYSSDTPFWWFIGSNSKKNETFSHGYNIDWYNSWVSKSITYLLNLCKLIHSTQSNSVNIDRKFIYF